MRVQRLLTARILARAFVSARLSIGSIADALQIRYGDGEYVNPEGPLNLMRGHACVNGHMIEKQRKFAAPMRLGYCRAGDAGDGRCMYTRNAREDEVREYPAHSEALAYLSDYYKILKSMFTVEDDAAVVDKSRQAPFWNLFESEREKLFAALLLRAGGADIWVDIGGSAGQGKWVVSFVAHDAARYSDARLLDVEVADSATLAVVEFFAKYGGERMSDSIAGDFYFTEGPSFLIQAYICEFVEDYDAVVRIFRAAKEMAAKLPADESCGQFVPRFFTREENSVLTHNARYESLHVVEAVSDGAQRALLAHWRNFGFGSYGDGGDPANNASALLKLCYCLCSNPAAERWDTRLLSSTENELQRALEEFVRRAICASASLGDVGAADSSRKDNWESVGQSYGEFLAVARAEAGASETVAGCFNENISAGLATDPGSFLVVLAWVLGEPEEKLRYLRQLLSDALSSAESASQCRLVSDCVAELLSRFSEEPVKAHFCVCMAAGGARHGSLLLTFRSSRAEATFDYVVKLVFAPEKVEITFVSQEAALKGDQYLKLAHARRRLDKTCNPVLPRGAPLASSNLNNPSLCMLIRKSIDRCLNPDVRQAVADAHLAEVSAAEFPPACHAAIGRWMALLPLRSQKEALAAAECLLPVLKDHLAQGCARRALGPDSPVVAVLDNILGSIIAVADDPLRSHIVSGVRQCVGERTDLFPGMFLSADESPPVV